MHLRKTAGIPLLGMETSVINAPVIPTGIMDATSNKKADCYFYYYSSCNKGNACPFRHEPAALMNETMCVYWLQGNCSKPHCIYRHMEITKKRDKIPCFFESQPGGCKKLHCPFLHNNVLDRPREEDVPNNPDLILPVKDSEAEYETEQSETKKLQECVAAQLKLQRKLSQSHTSEGEKSPELQTPSITRKSFIVPLQDGESDSESVCVSPVKTSLPTRTCIVSEAERDWELERLREIQKEEGNLLGYSFTSEEQDDLRDHYSSPPSLIGSFFSCEDDEEFAGEDELITDHIIIRRDLSRYPRIPTMEEEQSCYVKKMLGSTLKKKNHNDILKRVASRSSPSSDSEGHVVIFNRTSHKDGLQVALNERLGPKTNQSTVKPSVKERLGKRANGLKNDIENKPRSAVTSRSLQDEPMKKRLGLKEEGVKGRLSLKDDRTKSRLTPKEETEQRPDHKTGFVIKSLADIRAEKESQKQNNQVRNVVKAPESLPLSCFLNSKKDSNREGIADVENIKVKTLAEIKAEKSKIASTKPSRLMAFHGSQSNILKKRPISPVRFGNLNKKNKTSLAQGNEKTENESRESAINFSPRKLALKKSTGGAAKKVNQDEFSSGLVAKVNSKLKSVVNSASQSTATEKAKKGLEEAVSEAHHQEECRTKASYDPSATKSGDCSFTSLNNQQGFVPQPSITRLDTFIDEEELLLQGDVTFDDDDIDEDQLLL